MTWGELCVGCRRSAVCREACECVSLLAKMQLKAFIPLAACFFQEIINGTSGSIKACCAHLLANMAGLSWPSDLHFWLLDLAAILQSCTTIFTWSYIAGLADLDFQLESRIAKNCLIITILLSCCSVLCEETPVVQRTCPSRCRNRCLLITTSAVGDGNCLQGVCRRIDWLLPLIQVTPCCVRDPCDQQVSEATSNCCHAPSTGRYIIRLLALKWFEC